MMTRSTGSIAVLVLWFAACSMLVMSAQTQSADSPSSTTEAPKKRSILSIIFDGVPTTNRDKPKKPAAVTSAEAAACNVPAVATEVAPIERPRPEIEKLTAWYDVQRALPTDITGGPDWVQALKQGVIAPRFRLPADPTPTGPPTLDTFLSFSAADDVPPLELNVEFVPGQLPLYAVVFPHSSHTLWLNCSSCHPGIVAERGSGMRRVFAGEYCGRCHGKVSFSPLTGCPRCHVKLAPARPEAMDEEIARARQDLTATSSDVLERGQTLYLDACAVCHGEKGDGTGPLADALNPLPRDFTAGKFKFRTTNSSSLPADSDLFRTITRGVPGTSMPPFSFLPYADRAALTQYVKTFSAQFSTSKPANPIDIPEPPPRTPELVEMGKNFYREADCHKCHGDTGRGDGPSASTLKDDWGRELRPFDLTSGRPKSGDTLKDYYRIIMTGLKGTPMPDFGEVFEPEQAWGVVYYVYSLGEKNRSIPPAVTGEIQFTRKAPPTPDPIDPTQDNQPPAQFAHWFHRMRVRCGVCHPAVFQMKAGANNITMDAIRNGQFCGKCHPSYPDPKALVAWPLTFDVCGRCHTER